MEAALEKSRKMEDQIRHKVFVSNLLNPQGKGGEDLRLLYRSIKDALKSHNGVEFAAVKNTADIWMRDYMPIQIDRDTFVTYKYRPDYLWSPERRKYITTRFSTPANILENREKEMDLPFYRPGVKLVECDLIIDGGNVVVCGDRIILTDKIFYENRPKSPSQIINELKRAFGKEVIIIPSDPYEIEESRICDKPEKYELPLCHADGVLAPIDDESILIADYGEDPLGYTDELTDVLSRYFKPENIKRFDFGELWTADNWIYINFLRVGNVVLMPASKDQACNELAESQLKRFLKVNNIIRIDTSAISFDNKDNCGGALHCITWEVTL